MFGCHLLCEPRHEPRRSPFPGGGHLELGFKAVALTLGDDLSHRTALQRSLWSDGGQRFESCPREPTIPMGMVILVGLGVTLSALVIQALAAGLGTEAMTELFMRRSVGVSLWRNSLATLMLIVILLAGHMVQVAVWATVFMSNGEFSEFAIAFYHSAVNYTTLGYGDIVMSPRWRLLGPMEAANGTLAFGWSTAVIVTVVIRLVRYRHLAKGRRSARP